MHKAAYNTLKEHSLSGSGRPKMRTPAAAIYTGFSVSFLNKARTYGTGPDFIKLPGGGVIYDPDDIDRWLAEHKRSSTSE